MAAVGPAHPEVNGAKSFSFSQRGTISFSTPWGVRIHSAPSWAAGLPIPVITSANLTPPLWARTRKPSSARCAAASVRPCRSMRAPGVSCPLAQLLRSVAVKPAALGFGDFWRDDFCDFGLQDRFGDVGLEKLAFVLGGLALHDARPLPRRAATSFGISTYSRPCAFMPPASVSASCPKPKNISPRTAPRMAPPVSWAISSP